MMGNLNENYRLRLDRVRRLHCAFRRGSITEREYRIMLAQEGYAQSDSFRPVGEVVDELLERLRPS